VATDMVSVVKDGRDITEKRRKDHAPRVSTKTEDGNAGGTDAVSSEDDGDKPSFSGGRKNGESNASEEGDAQVEAVFPNPVDPALSSRVRKNETDQTRRIDGRLCRGYAYEMDDANGTGYTGMVWIEEDTGVPLHISAGLTELPRFVTEFAMGISFSGTPDRWYAVEGTMEGSVTIIVVKRRFRVTMEFSDYFRYPSED